MRRVPQKTWERIIERERGLCLLCSQQGTQVHHIVPRSQWGKNSTALRDNEKNLCLLCAQCHTDERETREEIARIMSIMQKRYGYKYTEEKFRRWAVLVDD